MSLSVSFGNVIGEVRYLRFVLMDFVLEFALLLNTQDDNCIQNSQNEVESNIDEIIVLSSKGGDSFSLHKQEKENISASTKDKLENATKLCECSSI